MTDNPEAATERFQNPPPPTTPASTPVERPSRFAQFRRDPAKVFLAAAIFGLFGFGALTFTAGYWVGQAGHPGGHVLERFDGPRGHVFGGPMGFGRAEIAVPPQESTTTEPAPTTTPAP